MPFTHGDRFTHDPATPLPAWPVFGVQSDVRLALAQALITRPRILLLDEPFGALDPGVRVDMHELITELWREHGLTILMVTHDIREAFKLGTRVVAIDKRRHDPQAPHRYGSTAVYDFPLEKPGAEAPEALEAMFARQDRGAA